MAKAPLGIAAAREWAAETAKAGRPDSEILTACVDEIRHSGIPVLRQWDRG